MKIWSVANDKVLRGKRTIATITLNPDGTMRWDGLGMYRTNFSPRKRPGRPDSDVLEDIMEDVKYYYVHGFRPTTFTVKRLY